MVEQNKTVTKRVKHVMISKRRIRINGEKAEDVAIKIEQKCHALLSVFNVFTLSLSYATACSSCSFMLETAPE